VVWLSVDIDEGKKAEERPRLVAQLQAILNVLPAYTWYAAPSGALTFVNKRTADYLGLPKDHPLRFGIDVGAQWDNWVPLLHPDDQEESRKYWSNCLRTGEAVEHSYRVRSAQGDYRWFLTRSEPLRASDGTLLLWIGATLDIEELKRAEQALRESESNLRQDIDTVPGLLWSIGPDGELTQINQGVLDYSGMRFEDHLGYYKFHHPDDLSDALNAFSHAMQTGTSYQALSRLRRANGEYRWHQVRAQPLRDREGRIVQWYGLSVDIEERKQAEDRLRRSEAYLAEAQRLSHTVSFGWTPSTGELHRSDETFRILEYDPSIKPTIERVLQRIHPDDRAMMRQFLDETSRGEKDFDVAHRLLMPDGSVKHVQVVARAIDNEPGEIEFVGAVMDVTAAKEADQALRESEQRFRDYAHTASDWYWETDRDHKFTRVTDYDRLRDLGFQPVSRIGLTRWDYATDVESEPEKWELHRSMLEARQPFRDFVYPAARSDGSLVFYKTSGKPIYDAKGAFLGYRGTGADVTATVRAEAALQESQAKFRDYAESASDWLWEIGPDYKFTLLTENAFGSNAADRIGTVCWDDALDLATEPEKWRLLWATLDSRKPFRDFVYCSMGGGGSPMYHAYPVNAFTL